MGITTYFNSFPKGTDYAQVIELDMYGNPCNWRWTKESWRSYYGAVRLWKRTIGQLWGDFSLF